MRGGKRLQPNRHKLGLRVSDGLTFPLTSQKEKFEFGNIQAVRHWDKGMSVQARYEVEYGGSGVSGFSEMENSIRN